MTAMGPDRERLERLRLEIDGIDAELASLFQRRMDVVAEVAVVKRRAGLPVYDAPREQAVISRGRGRVSPENADGVEMLLRLIMGLSKSRQEELTIDTI